MYNKNNLSLLLLFFCTIGCKVNSLKYSYILYETKACTGPKTFNHSFLVYNNDYFSHYYMNTLNEYISCLDTTDIEHCKDFIRSDFSYYPLLYNKVIIRKHKNIFQYLTHFKSEQVDSFYKKGEKAYTHREVISDNVVKMIFSFQKDDTIKIKSENEKLRTNYITTVYTGIDTILKINNKRLKCGIFFDLRNEVGYNLIYIHKKSGIELKKIIFLSKAAFNEKFRDIELSKYLKECNPDGSYFSVEQAVRILPMNREHRKIMLDKLFPVNP